MRLAVVGQYYMKYFYYDNVMDLGCHIRQLNNLEPANVDFIAAKGVFKTFYKFKSTLNFKVELVL